MTIDRYFYCHFEITELYELDKKIEEYFRWHLKAFASELYFMDL